MATQVGPAKQRDESVLARQPDGLPDPVLEPNAQIVLEKRYLKRDGQRVLETPGGGFWRVAEDIARGSEPYESDESLARLRREYYLMMARLEFVPNSPTLMNAGKKNGLQYSACYVLPVPDSMDEIFETNKRAALIHQSGGGTGFAFSRLRPSGDIVGSTGGIASGPVSFLEVYNASTESVKQGGTRRGANMGILRVGHPDILKFIDCKRELNDRHRHAYESVTAYLGPEQQTGLKQALLEGQIANFNISVGVTDRFMQALARGEEYELTNPRSKEVVGTLNARDVFKRMVQGAWETGDPGVIFLDRINAGPANPVPEMGPVEATNPCGEQPLYPNEACNLGSINLAKFVRPVGHRSGQTNGKTSTPSGNGHANGRAGFSRHPAIDWERLGKTTRLAIRFLDDVIAVNPYPDAAIDESVKANRRIGLGVMGWADLLMMLEIEYDSQEALDLAEQLMRFINETSHEESCNLADVRGPFPNWERSIYKNGRPQRNSTVTTIAPTGTISIIAGCSSGIEPIFALVFDRKGSLDGLMQLEVNEYFTEIAKREGFWTDELAEQVHRRGTVRGLEAVPVHWQGVFGTSHDIAPEWHVRMQAAFQRYTDNAVSKTINLPHDATVDDVETAYRMSYELGCNGITVYRDGSKLGVLHAGNLGGTASAGPAEAAAALTGPSDRVKPRPQLLRGLTYQEETPLGTAYVTVNADEQDQPYEVFVNQGKTGSDVAAMSVAIGKLASLVLGLPSTMSPTQRLGEVARRLRGIGGGTPWGFGAQRARSLPDALARVLETYLDQTRSTGGQADADTPRAVPDAQLALPIAATGEFCPDCSNGLVFQEGCSKCPHCGFSKC
jgi:ribonucleoside-diphosphate reductase alpha chain